MDQFPGGRSEGHGLRAFCCSQRRPEAMEFFSSVLTRTESDLTEDRSASPYIGNINIWCPLFLTYLIRELKFYTRTLRLLMNLALYWTNDRKNPLFLAGFILYRLSWGYVMVELRGIEPLAS